MTLIKRDEVEPVRRGGMGAMRRKEWGLFCISVKWITLFAVDALFFSLCTLTIMLDIHIDNRNHCHIFRSQKHSLLPMMSIS